jgi:hypothetical protein
VRTTARASRTFASKIQPFFTVDAVNPFVIVLETFSSQHNQDSLKTIPNPHRSNFLHAHA